MEYISSVLPPLTWTKFHGMVLENYVLKTLRDPKKDDFMSLEQGGMFVATEDKFHVLSRYAMQLQVLCVHMTSSWRIFNKVIDYVKNMERVM